MARRALAKSSKGELEIERLGAARGRAHTDFEDVKEKPKAHVEKSCFAQGHRKTIGTMEYVWSCVGHLWGKCV